MPPLPSLSGQWTLTRHITSVEGIATFSGTAEFVPMPNGTLHYTERGVLAMPRGHSVSAFRTYIFQPNETGFAVFFDEMPPRLFHHIALLPDGNALLGRATHFCAPDTYVSTYRFLPEGSFTIDHDVTGPKKRYASASSYTKST